MPIETGVSIVGPRSAGSGGTYRLEHIFLAPFSKRQITSFVNKTFPIYDLFKFSDRLSAFKISKEIPELSARPMLLALLPDLVSTKFRSKELFEIYNFMIDQWLLRESSWISAEALLAASKDLASFIYLNMQCTGVDRVSPETGRQLLITRGHHEIDWDKFRSRSLLNRDGAGMVKFAHRSILEFLYVLSAIDGDNREFEVPWTDLMRTMLISWGHACSDDRSTKRALEILQLDLPKANLVPLSKKRAVPGPVSKSDFANLSGFGSLEIDRKRSIAAHWRLNTIEVIDNEDDIILIDKEYNLYWNIINFSKLELDDIRLYRTTLANIPMMTGRSTSKRLASYDEFISLIGALEVCNRSDVLPEEELYWIGDSMASRRYLLVKIG